MSTIVIKIQIHRFFEERRYKFVLTTIFYIVIEVVGAELPAIKLPDLKRVDVINQDYVWEGDNAAIFLVTTKKFKQEQRFIRILSKIIQRQIFIIYYKTYMANKEYS